MWSMPLEEFHLLKEGITKCMLDRMCFGTARKVAKEVQGKLNLAYTGMKVFSETSRRPRDLKMSQLKGKNITKS